MSRTPESEIAWAAENEPEQLKEMMEKFSESDYRLISATVRRVTDMIEGMEDLEQAVRYCKAMSAMTRAMADKKAEAVQKHRDALSPAPVLADGLLDAWKNGCKE